MRIRSVLTLLALVLTTSACRADIFWYTEQGATPGVRSFDSVAGTLGPPVTLPAPGTEPRVAGTYAFSAPLDIDSLYYSTSEGPITAFVDNPYVVIIDTLPGSPTYNTVIQTVDMRDAAILGDDPGIGYLKFHPLGTRIYVSGVGSGFSLPSVRICRQDVGLPAATLLYSFTPATHPGDRLDTELDLSGEWGPMFVPEIGGPMVGIHVPFDIDIAPDTSKVYFACHTETGGANISNVHGFTIDTAGDWIANLTVGELPSALFNHCFQLSFSSSTLSYDNGGSRCYVTNQAAPEPPAAPFPPVPGFVMVINITADATTLKVDAGIVPPALPPSTVLDATTQSFLIPVGVDCAKAALMAFVADRDLSVTAPATDGMIGEKIVASITPVGTPTVSDKTFTYFADPTPADDVDPRHWGVAVDNDDSEVVFCNLGSAGSPPTLNHYGIDGVLVAAVPVTAGNIPVFISCQSGTGVLGPPGSGGAGPPGSDPYNDNGAEVISSHSDESDGGKKKCGLTGMEAPLLMGLWMLVRRRSKKSAK